MDSTALSIVLNLGVCSHVCAFPTSFPQLLVMSIKKQKKRLGDYRAYDRSNLRIHKLHIFTFANCIYSESTDALTCKATNEIQEANERKKDQA